MATRVIEELTPSTNHEYISVKYHGKNERGYKQNNLINDHTPVQQNKDTPSTKFVHTSTPLQATSSLTFSGGGGILTNDHTPIIAGDDTNILRVNNLYTFGIERLFNASCQLIDSSTAKLYKPVKVICNIKKAQ